MSMSPALREQLWFGSTAQAAEPMPPPGPDQTDWRCVRALQDPETLKEWPEELLESSGFPGCLARLISWTRLHEAMEAAPPAQSLQPWLELSRGQASFLEDRIDESLRAWFYREHGRLIGFQCGDSLPWLRRSLQQAERLGQLAELEKTRAFLDTGQENGAAPVTPGLRQQLDHLLEAAAGMVESADLPELARQTVAAVHRSLPVEAALWLEKGQSWQAHCWCPQQITPRYSQSLLEVCLQNNELTWGGPEQLEASRSVLLSKVRCMLALPLGSQQVLFLWQTEQQDWMRGEHLEVLQFLARLASVLRNNLQLNQLAQTELESAQRTHARWEALFHQSEQVAIAELDENAELIRANPAYMRLGDNLPPLPRDQSTRLVRLGEGAQARWFQMSEWKVPGEPGSYRALVDVSEGEIPAWFDYLEELRQKMAADLHDGPAQLAVVLQMLEGTPKTQQLYQEVRNRLDWLRSPWLENLHPPEWLRQLVVRRFLRAEWRQSDDFEQLSRSQAQTVMRLVVGCLEQLEAGGQVRSLEMEWGLSSCLRWTPALPVGLPDTARQAASARLDILKGRYSLQAGELRIHF